MFIFTRKDTSNQRKTKHFRVVFCEKGRGGAEEGGKEAKMKKVYGL